MRREIFLTCRAASILTIALLILSIILSPGKAAADEPARDLALHVQVNGREVGFSDARPFIDENGRVQAPIRFVAQALGAEVSWNAATASISGNGKEIILTVGSSTAIVNGTAVTLDSGAVLIADRIYIPVRFIAETLGAGVQWDADTRTAKIAMDKPVIKSFGISHTKVDAGWYTIPRTFVAWVESDNAQKVDFYLTPTGTGQEPVKIATSTGKGGRLSITYRLPQESTLAHFWAVAVNERGEQSTDIIKVYRETAPEPPAEIDGIPLHPSFGWGGKIDPEYRAHLLGFLGPDYDKSASRVLLSDGLFTPYSYEIADWYQKRLTEAGWQIQGPVDGGPRWGLTAEKDGRFVTIIYALGYWGEDNPGPVPGLEEGYRLVIVTGNKPVREGFEIFTPVETSVPDDGQKAFIQEVKGTRGAHRKGDLVVIALGAQPNPGYGLEIVKTEMSEGQATLYIKLTKPEPDKMYAAVISYPYLAGKVNLPENATIRFVIEETGEVL